MGKRVDEIVDQGAAGAADFAVLAADGINFPGSVAEEGGDFIGEEAGGVDYAAGFDGFILGVFFVADTETYSDRPGNGFEGNYFGALDYIGALVGGEAGVGAD